MEQVYSNKIHKAITIQKHRWWHHIKWTMIGSGQQTTQQWRRWRCTQLAGWRAGRAANRFISEKSNVQCKHMKRNYCCVCMLLCLHMYLYILIWYMRVHMGLHELNHIWIFNNCSLSLQLIVVIAIIVVVFIIVVATVCTFLHR